MLSGFMSAKNIICRRFAPRHARHHNGSGARTSARERHNISRRRCAKADQRDMNISKSFAARIRRRGGGTQIWQHRE